MPYHRYVFDEKRKVFVGDFEKMYQHEDIDEYDSWQQESGPGAITFQVSKLILDMYNFDRILDIGCGKGTFTQILKRRNNYVLGMDISPTAIKKASIKYPECEFLVKAADEAALLGKFNLVVLMEVLSYIENWRDLIYDLRGMTEWLYICLFIPDNPIGYVKSYRDLLDVVSDCFAIKTEIIIDEYSFCVLARASKGER